MWVFGYGSLVWNPGFSYKESRIGYIRGYVRRFWQGNDYHRGDPKRLGRVATLVEDEEGITWGRAFLVDAENDEASLTYLDTRESKLGGYSTTIVTFHPRDPKEQMIPVLLYMALPTNHLYRGPAPLPDVATEIAEAHGICGHNSEYILRLAEFMREQAPDFWDEHLFHLELLVKARLKAKHIPIENVMDFQASFENICSNQLDQQIKTSVDKFNDNNHNESFNRVQDPQRSPDFTSRVPTRKLRCVDL